MVTTVDDLPDMSNASLPDETAAIVASFDPNLLVSFLTDLAEVTLNASRDDLQVSLLSSPDTLQRCSKFAADTNLSALYIRKELGEASAQNGTPLFVSWRGAYLSGVARAPFVYYLSSEISVGPATHGVVAIMKRPLPLDSSVPLQNQLQIINLPGGLSRTGQDTVSPYETLHTLVHFGVSAYFEVCTRGENEQIVRRGKGIDDAKTGASCRLLPNLRYSVG
jgi:dynein cytoplasmic 1 heavy chain